MPAQFKAFLAQAVANMKRSRGIRGKGWSLRDDFIACTIPTYYHSRFYMTCSAIMPSVLLYNSATDEIMSNFKAKIAERARQPGHMESVSYMSRH